MKIVALLESMWGWGGYNEPGEEAPRFFRINPDNFSGRRLYRLCGDATLVVTNSCRVVQQSANHHGTPDPQWVKENISKAIADGCDLVLVCGRVAKETFAASGVQFEHVIHMDHPAARRWTNKALDEVAAQVESRRNAMNGIGWAVKEMQNGEKVARAGWNGKGMWIGFVPHDQWGLGSGAPFDYGAAGPNSLRPWIGIKSADGLFVPWQASQTDLLATDWEIVTA